TGEDGALRRVPGPARVRVDGAERRHPRREGPVPRRRHRTGEGPVCAVRRHRRAPGGRRGGAQMNWAALDWTILGPARVAGLLVLATHVPLGMEVLDRGIVFIDLAIAQ